MTTPPPALPRQISNPDDPYGISSLLAEFSSLYPESLYPEFYSSYDSSYYSSILADLASYSVPGYSIPDSTATAGGRGTAGASNPTGTAAAASGGDSSGSGGSAGLPTGAKIGIGVGVPLAVFLLAGLGVLLWCMGKKKGKKSSTTVVAPAQPGAPFQSQFQQPPQQQMGYMNHQGYMPGYQQSVSPPPQYMTPPPPGAGYGGGYGGYGKGPETAGAVELEQEYHFARPGVVEMDGGQEPPQQQQPGKKKNKKKK